MKVIQINVNRQMDGYAFSIAPSIRTMIKSLFPDSYPANNIFISYDAKSDFENFYGKLERYIYPVLLGIENTSDLNKKVDEILFVDTQTGNILHSYKLSA